MFSVDSKSFNSSINLVPFRTIKLYINGYHNHLVSYKTFASNIYGNLLAFMPFAFFIPLIFTKVDKYFKFLIIMVIIILQIEILQFITMSGACDIDDVILNLFGASLAYLIFRQKYVYKFLRKIFLLEEEL